MNEEPKNMCDDVASARKNVEALLREHRLMFGALAEIKAALPEHLGEGGDYLSQLLEFRRKADEILKQTWKNIGL